jgi:DNA-binding NtrC family response regulator
MPASDKLCIEGEKQMAKRIFVVDDEKWIADTLVVILGKYSYEASAFYNAQSALDQMKVCCPELVISDVVMPGMSGVEMAVIIRVRHPECKILLLSGQAAYGRYARRGSSARIQF